MFEGIVTVLDKTIELIQLKQTNNKEFYILIISPLFIEFEKVAEDYFELFNSYSTRKSELTKVRNQYLQSRIKVTELANKYGENVEDTTVLAFFDSIREFFFVSPILEKRDLGSSAGAYFIDLVSGERERVKLPGDVSQKREELKNNMEIKWGKVVSIYGELQMKYNLPIGYKA